MKKKLKANDKKLKQNARHCSINVKTENWELNSENLKQISTEQILKTEN